MIKCDLMRPITAPANRVSSRLNLSFQAEQPSITFFFVSIKWSHTADKLGKEPVITSEAPFCNDICNNLVPLVVVSTRVLPATNSRGYSAGELPCSKPGITFPSLSPAVIPPVFLPICMHLSTVSTGITLAAPLNSAVAIVEVARNTSITTTILLLTSYMSNNLGERIVCNSGFVLMGRKYRSEEHTS